jgi:hypothetical protein
MPATVARRKRVVGAGDRLDFTDTLRDLWCTLGGGGPHLARETNMRTITLLRLSAAGVLAPVAMLGACSSSGGGGPGTTADGSTATGPGAGTSMDATGSVHSSGTGATTGGTGGATGAGGATTGSHTVGSGSHVTSTGGW